MLGVMGIYELNFFIIGNYKNSNSLIIDKRCKLEFIETNSEKFIKFLNEPGADFIEYNKNSLYVLKNSNYIQIKQLFKKIKGYDTNLGRGASQKAHITSPLELRLYSYLLALCNFSYKHISLLNVFNYLTKDRYLVYT